MNLRREVTLKVIQLLLEQLKPLTEHIVGGSYKPYILSGKKLSDILRPHKDYNLWIERLRRCPLDFEFIDELIEAFRKRQLRKKLEGFGIHLPEGVDLADEEREWFIEGVQEILREIRGIR
ncbi:MAG: hypothetical protein QXT16_08940 [Candidatus Caldarchaeum sp.]